MIFLPLVFAGYWLIQPKWRNAFLLLASYYFYFSYNPWFLLLLMGTSGMDFYLAKCIGKTQTQHKRKLFLWLSIISNLGVLSVFKYAVFFYNTTGTLFSSNFSPLETFIIPAGLSFYTFQSISYTIDVYRNKYKPDDTLIDFLLYVSFFPHMVAGPIMRHDVLMPQLKVRQYFKSIDWASFIKLCIWGYFKKMVIADNLAFIINDVFEHVSNYNSIELLISGLLFLIQLYCDFSGYSDIATGVAKLFHINLSINWNRPLLATSVTQYWKRHHLSLTSWFREYVYISLGGNKVKLNRWIINILLVFVLSGFWHGANFTFIVWGLLNGIFYVMESLMNKYYPGLRAPKLIGWLYTLFFISLFFIAFRAENIPQLLEIYERIFITFHSAGMLQHLIAIKGVFFSSIMAMLIMVLLIKELKEEYNLLNRPFTQREVVLTGTYMIILLCIFLFGNFRANSFIYFQF